MHHAIVVTILALSLLLPAAGWSQSAHPGHGQHPGGPLPYTGQESRAIKALPDEDVQQLLAGAGMGFAKAAELNHYPGPRHVLDLAPQLGLSEAQLAQTQAVFESMRARAAALGAAIVALERELDAGFAASHMDAAALSRLTAEIARLQGQLRATHLQAHLAVRRLLSAQQVSAYDRLRGYAP